MSPTATDSANASPMSPSRRSPRGRLMSETEAKVDPFKSSTTDLLNISIIPSYALTLSPTPTPTPTLHLQTPPPPPSFSALLAPHPSSHSHSPHSLSGLMLSPNTPKKSSERLKLKRSVASPDRPISARNLEFPSAFPSTIVPFHRGLQTESSSRTIGTIHEEHPDSGDDDRSRDSGFESDLSGAPSSIKRTNSEQTDSLATDSNRTSPLATENKELDTGKGKCNRCMWTDCSKSLLNPNEDIWYHLLQEHILPQKVNKSHTSRNSGDLGRRGGGSCQSGHTPVGFVRAAGRVQHDRRKLGSSKKIKLAFSCRWSGCRVFEIPPARGDSDQKLEWLENHVRERHGGPRPYCCIIDGCCQRFASKAALNSHLASGHKNQSAEHRRSRSSTTDSNNVEKSTTGNEQCSIDANHLLISKSKKKRRKYFLSPVRDPADDFMDEATVEIIQSRLAHCSVDDSTPRNERFLATATATGKTGSQHSGIITKHKLSPVSPGKESPSKKRRREGKGKGVMSTWDVQGQLLVLFPNSARLRYRMRFKQY